MTKLKSLLIAMLSLAMILCTALFIGMPFQNKTLTAQAADETLPDSEVKTHTVYLRWGTLQADGKTSMGTGRGYASLDVGEGTVVTIIAQEESDAVFVKWIAESGGITFENENSATTTFVMQKEDVWLNCEYKYIRSVTVKNGTLESGETSGKFIEGKTVKITAAVTLGGKEFVKWVAPAGEVTFENENSATTTFVMPDSAVVIKATYKDKTSSGGEDNSSDTGNSSGELIPSENEGLSGGAIAGIVVGSVAVVGIGGFSIFWFVIKKKSFTDFIAIFKKQ